MQKDKRDMCETVKLNKRILIFTEGKKTEQNYYNSIKRVYRLPSVEVFDSKKNTGKELLSQALEMQKKARRENNEYDEIWIVIDRDGYTKHPEVFDKANKYPYIKIAFSSPCFEFWFLLHFENTTAPFHNCDDVISRLKKHIPDYGKNIDYFSFLSNQLQNAIINAKRVNEHQFKTANCPIWQFNPYTENVKLVERLINFNRV